MIFRLTGDIDKLTGYESKKFEFYIQKFLEKQDQNSEAIINLGIRQRSFKGQNLSRVKINLTTANKYYYSNIREFGPLQAVKQALNALDFQIKKKTKF